MIHYSADNLNSETANSASLRLADGGILKLAQSYHTLR